MITIAGRTVKVGDTLYHNGFQAWGTIKRVGEGTAEYHLEGRSHGNVRKLYITQGGNINGKRVIYWHKPLTLDLPTADTTKIQGFVDLLVSTYPEA